MKIEEGFRLWEIAPKLDQNSLRDNYVMNQIFNVGQIVENLNTGMIGKIIRRGANYLICVTEDNIMFKPWIKDVKESEIPSKNLKKLVNKAVKRVDDNIDGFVDKEDPKTGPYGAFLPQARNLPTNVKFTNVSGVPANQREVGTDAYRKYTMKMTGTKEIKNFINKYKKK